MPSNRPFLFTLLLLTEVGRSADQHLLIGNRQPLANGYAQSFVGVDPATRNPSALGVSLSTLKQPGMSGNTRLDLPKTSSVPPFQTIELYWSSSFLEVRFLWEPRADTSPCRQAEDWDLLICEGSPDAISWRISYEASAETREIRLPPDLKKTGYFPEQLTIVYDPGLRQYRISLENLQRSS